MAQVNIGSFRGKVETVSNGVNNANPRIEFLGGKKAVVTWINNDGTLQEAHVRVLDTDFSNLGTSYSIGYSGAFNYNPEALSFGGEQYVIAWTHREAYYPLDIDTFIQLYRGNTAITSIEQLLSDGQNHQYNPTMAKISADKMVVAWDSDSLSGYKVTIEAKIYEVNKDDHHEIKEKKNINIDITSNRYHKNPLVAALSDGKFILVWEEWNGSSKKLMGQVFKSDGNKERDSFQIHENAGEGYKVLVLPNDNMVLSWTASDADGTGIYAEIIDRQGNVVKSEFLVNTDSVSNQHTPRIISNEDGFSISWLSEGSNEGIKLQRFDTNGEKVKENCQILRGAVSFGNYDVAAIGNGEVGVTWTHASHAVYMGVGSYTQLCDITLTSSINATGTESLKITDSNTVTGSESNTGSRSKTQTQTETRTQTETKTSSATETPTQTNTVTGSDSKSASNTKTGTHTESSTVSGSVSGTETRTLSETHTGTGSISDSSTHSGTTSRSESQSKTGSKSGTVSETASMTDTSTDTKTETMSDTITHSGTNSRSDSQTATHTESVSDSNTKTATVSESKSKSATDTSTDTQTITHSSSMTGSDSATDTGTATKTVSATDTGTATETDTVSATSSRSESKSGSKTMTETASKTSTETIALTGSKTITLKCGQDVHDMFANKVSLEIYIDDIEIKSVDTSNPSIYSISTATVFENSQNRPTIFKGPLNIKYNTKDIINSFWDYIKHEGYIINGTVYYSNDITEDDIVGDDSSIIHSDLTQCSRDKYTKYKLSQDNIGYSGINGCNFNKIRRDIEVEVAPGRCVRAEMVVSFNKNNITYNARATIKVNNKFSNQAVTDELRSVQDCLLKEGLPSELVNDDRELEVYITGSITHSALTSIKVQTLPCDDKPIVSNVEIICDESQHTYPTDLSPYAQTKTFVEYYSNNKQDIVSVKTSSKGTISMCKVQDGIGSSINSHEFIKTGKVTFHYKEGDAATKTGAVPARTIESDLYSILGGAPVYCNDVSINDGSGSISLVEGERVEVKKIVHFYDKVQSTYTAQCYLIARDESGQVLTGSKLNAFASATLNTGYIVNNDRISFSLSGTATESIYDHTETVIEKGTKTKTPKVIGSLLYIITPAEIQSCPSISATKIYDGIRMYNGNTYGSVEQTAQVKFEVPTKQNINLASDFSMNEVVMGGNITYVIDSVGMSDTCTSQVGGSVGATSRATFPWYPHSQQFSSEGFTIWDKVTIFDEVTKTLVPTQCLKVQLNVNYAEITTAFTALGYFTATDEYGKALKGNNLLQACQEVINKGVSLNPDGQCVFYTEGTMTQTVIGDTTVSTVEC